MTEPEQDRTTPTPISQARYRAALDAHAETLPPGVETRLRAMRREAVGEASRGRLRPFLWGGLASAAALILALTTTLESERGGGRRVRPSRRRPRQVLPSTRSGRTTIWRWPASSI